MKTRVRVLVLVLFVLSVNANARDGNVKKRIPGNTLVYAEAGGAGVIASVNIDQRLSLHKATGLGLRAGVGIGRYKHGGLYEGSTPVALPNEEEIVLHKRKKTYVSIPFALNWVIMTKAPDNSIEIGAGGTYLSEELPVYNNENLLSEAGNMLWHASVMYRYIPSEKGLSLRVGALVIRGTGGDILPSAALSLGYSF